MGRAIVDHLIPDDESGRIPIVGITGSRGKTAARPRVRSTPGRDRQLGPRGRRVDVHAGLEGGVRGGRSVSHAPREAVDRPHVAHDRGSRPQARIAIDHAKVRLEAQKDGTNNWTLWPTEAATPDDRTEVPYVRSLRIRDSRLTYFRQGVPESDIDLQLDLAARAGAPRRGFAAPA